MAITSDFRALDARRWHREGLLTPGNAFGWDWTRNAKTVASIQVRSEAGRVILDYQHKKPGGDWQPIEYPLCLEWTDCTLGGRRAWFLCPAQGCARRVAKVYLGDAGIFACRHCNKLAYACQRETADGRAMRRADKIRRRLGWSAGIANPAGTKPKGMHWRTYQRLTSEHNAFSAAAFAGMEAELGLMTRRLERIRDALKNNE